MKIRDLLAKNGILIDLQETEKSAVLTQIAQYLASLYGLGDSQLIVRKILEREAEMSTGIGYGIAIPHARLQAIDRLYMVAARSKKGINFSALDEQPVHLIFLMLSPLNASVEHTQILSALSRVMSYEEMRKKLFDATAPEEFLDLIIKGEDRYVE